MKYGISSEAFIVKMAETDEDRCRLKMISQQKLDEFNEWAASLPDDYHVDVINEEHMVILTVFNDRIAEELGEDEWGISLYWYGHEEHMLRPCVFCDYEFSIRGLTHAIRDEIRYYDNERRVEMADAYCKWLRVEEEKI